ncbi:Hsp20/alpha crystallin family protein [Variovorax sp. J22P168]|uniref:Hsp20/alpha crystallin family protein n=1 Tax=Variovorax jilinensis TaxID=3053513 RepID=UPI002578AB69|nr:Hsp20/alpha crystallin family protein [Variovorax sp. J22P168]MDM0015896.1 Hsp20/alpha crystallin family protein [Variovorax sp. J22P168]
MTLDSQKWFPFKFNRSGAAERPADSGATGEASSQARSSTEWPAPTKLLQALDPFNMLPGPLRGAFGGTSGWFGDFGPAVFEPRIDIFDDGDALRLTAELPGMEKKDLEIDVADNILVLRGEKRVDAKRVGQACYPLERAFGSFQRVLPLHDGVDLEQAEARFDQGVLTLRLPKKAGDTKASRKLEIK